MTELPPGADRPPWRAGAYARTPADENCDLARNVETVEKRARQLAEARDAAHEHGPRRTMAQIMPHLVSGGCRHDAIPARSDDPWSARRRRSGPGSLPAVRDPARVRPRRGPTADRHASGGRAHLRRGPAPTAAPRGRSRLPPGSQVALPARVPERRRRPEPLPAYRPPHALLLSLPACPSPSSSSCWEAPLSWRPPGRTRPRPPRTSRTEHPTTTTHGSASTRRCSFSITTFSTDAS